MSFYMMGGGGAISYPSTATVTSLSYMEPKGSTHIYMSSRQYLASTYNSRSCWSYVENVNNAPYIPTYFTTGASANTLYGMEKLVMNGLSRISNNSITSIQSSNFEDFYADTAALTIGKTVDSAARVYNFLPNKDYLSYGHHDLAALIAVNDNPLSGYVPEGPYPYGKGSDIKNVCKFNVFPFAVDTYMGSSQYNIETSAFSNFRDKAFGGFLGFDNNASTPGTETLKVDYAPFPVCSFGYVTRPINAEGMYGAIFNNTFMAFDARKYNFHPITYKDKDNNKYYPFISIYSNSVYVYLASKVSNYPDCHSNNIVTSYLLNDFEKIHNSYTFTKESWEGDNPSNSAIELLNSQNPTDYYTKAIPGFFWRKVPNEHDTIPYGSLDDYGNAAKEAIHSIRSPFNNLPEDLCWFSKYTPAGSSSIYYSPIVHSQWVPKCIQVAYHVGNFGVKINQSIYIGIGRENLARYQNYRVLTYPTSTYFSRSVNSNYFFPSLNINYSKGVFPYCRVYNESISAWYKVSYNRVLRNGMYRTSFSDGDTCYRHIYQYPIIGTSYQGSYLSRRDSYTKDRSWYFYNRNVPVACYSYFPNDYVYFVNFYIAAMPCTSIVDEGDNNSADPIRVQLVYANRDIMPFSAYMSSDTTYWSSNYIYGLSDLTPYDSSTNHNGLYYMSSGHKIYDSLGLNIGNDASGMVSCEEAIHANITNTYNLLENSIMSVSSNFYIGNALIEDYGSKNEWVSGRKLMDWEEREKEIEGPFYVCVNGYFTDRYNHLSSSGVDYSSITMKIRVDKNGDTYYVSRYPFSKYFEDAGVPYKSQYDSMIWQYIPLYTYGGYNYSGNLFNFQKGSDNILTPFSGYLESYAKLNLSSGFFYSHNSCTAILAPAFPINTFEHSLVSSTGTSSVGTSSNTVIMGGQLLCWGAGATFYATYDSRASLVSALYYPDYVNSPNYVSNLKPYFSLYMYGSSSGNIVPTLVSSGVLENLSYTSNNKLVIITSRGKGYPIAYSASTHSSLFNRFGRMFSYYIEPIEE